ncbi:MAG: DUF1232 domain-containing protein [Planctomycetaceae bacterium]|nr:DUF1232 domain-containing protein [Planctomycetaceae bacterium]
MSTATNRISLMGSAIAEPGQGPGRPGKIVAVLAILGAVVYLISPVDAIPDVIPGLCHLDDLGVIGIVLKNAKEAFWG